MLTELEQRAAVIEEAKAWIGTPFHENAAVKGAGVSCGHLLMSAYNPLSKDTGWPIPVPPVFARDWFFHTKEERFLDIIKQFCREVDTPQPGDIALFRLGTNPRPYSHGSLVIEWPHQILHAMWRSTVEIADATQPPFPGAPVLFFSPWGFRV